MPPTPGPFDIDFVLFDLDGTLVDTRLDIAAAANHVLASLGFAEEPVDRIQSWVGDGSRTLIARALAGRDADLDAAVTQFREYYVAHPCVLARPYEGVAEWLDETRGRIGVAIVTNKPLPIALEMLTALGWNDRFDPVLGERSVPRLKPHPEALQLALEIANVPPDRALMVGDGPQDLAAARAVGVPGIAAAYGFHTRERLEAERPDAVLERFSDLPKLIRAR